ncbi:PAS domain S-box-containing protein/diguanylate cyclase (GGDEF)-like protein OS=Ureibacillus acetophenoni OX=614649 GN=SAMN05877842_11969 PE=4 SV=1 [Ureibacillus acetophenoni]
MLNFINRFEQAFHYSPIGMAILSLEGKWLKVNPALTDMTGYAEEELLSINFQAITHPDDLEEDMKLLHELIEGEKAAYEMEKRYIHKNGNIVWILLSVSVVREGDQPLFLISQIQNITVRKQLECELVESEERFRNLITNLPDPVVVHDGEVILYANHSIAKLMGGSLQEVIGEPITNFIEPNMIDEAKQMANELIETNQPLYNFDFRIKSYDGTIRDAIFSAIPITYMGKKAVMVSYKDITERKNVERALKESEEKYRLLIEHSPLGIVLHQNRIIQYANSKALSIIGAKKHEDIIGKSIYQFIHPEFQFIVSRNVDNMENGDVIPQTYEKFIRLDGQEIDVELKGIPIQMNGQSAVQVVFWDVTEKKKEEDLVRYRAYHDTLTDLPNRLKFQIDLEEEINRDTTFTVMYLDLHGLKPVNDSYGHQAGDMVLIKVTSRLTGVLDSIGLLYRLGGDEFAIVLPGKRNEEELEGIINRLIEVMKQPIYISNSIVQMTASIGVVFSPEHGVDMDLLLRHADMAMYHAKKTNSIYKIYDR